MTKSTVPAARARCTSSPTPAPNPCHTREATGHHSELPGSSVVDGVHSPTKTLTFPHTPAADRADHAHRPVTMGEMHLVTGIQSRPIPKCLAATQLLCLTDVTHAQRQSIPLSNQDRNEASCIALACRPVLLWARGRRGARHQWRGLISPPVVRPYHARRTQERHRPAPHHVGQEAWLYDPTEDGDVESNPGPETPKRSPNVSNRGRVSSVLTPIKRLFGGAPTPEPQDGTSETKAHHQLIPPRMRQNTTSP